MGGLGVKVQHFPLTLLVVLTTLTLPCERDDVCGLRIVIVILRMMSVVLSSWHDINHSGAS